MSATNQNAIAKTPNSSVLGAWYYFQGLLVLLYGIWISISELNTDYTGPQRDIWDCMCGVVLRPVFPVYFTVFALLSLFAGYSLRSGRRIGFCKFVARFQWIWTIPGFLNAALLLWLQQQCAFYDPAWKTELGLAVFCFVLIVGVLGAHAMRSARD
jgi:hypothetical protein